MTRRGRILALAALLLLPSWGAATAQQTGTINVAWIANTEPDLAGYRLYADTDPNVFLSPPNPAGTAFTLNIAASETTASVTLAAGQTWYLALTAIDLSGNESGFSTVASAVPSITPTVRSLTPNSAEQGGSNISVAISGDNFTSGATVSFGPGITVNSVDSSGAPSGLVANISVDALAQVFARDVTVVNVGGGTGKKAAAFSVTVDRNRLDLDSSNRIDNGDFLILLVLYPSVQGDGTYMVKGDLDVDGRIDGADLAIFFANFGLEGPF